MTEEFKLEQQDPKRDEFLEKESKYNAAVESLKAVIENSTVVSEIEDAVYESGNDDLIELYSELRFNYLKQNNSFKDGDEEKLNDLELEKYKAVNEKGYLVDFDGNISSDHISQHDRRELDEDFITSVRSELLAIA